MRSKADTAQMAVFAGPAYEYLLQSVFWPLLLPQRLKSTLTSKGSYADEIAVQFKLTKGRFRL